MPIFKLWDGHPQSGKHSSKSCDGTKEMMCNCSGIANHNDAICWNDGIFWNSLRSVTLIKHKDGPQLLLSSNRLQSPKKIALFSCFRRKKYKGTELCLANTQAHYTKIELTVSCDHLLRKLSWTCLDSFSTTSSCIIAWKHAIVLFLYCK